MKKNISLLGLEDFFLFYFRIDANVDEATHHIEGAHTELLKYLRSVTSNRWLIIKVFAVLIIFFLIFIVFLA
jgi:syntaxin 5